MVPGQPDGQIGVEIVIDELKSEPVVRGGCKGGQEVSRDRGELVVRRGLRRLYIAQKARKLVTIVADSVRHKVVEVVETAEVGPHLKTLDLAAGAGVKVDGAAGGKVAVQSRRWSG